MKELKEDDIIGDFEFPDEWVLFGPLGLNDSEPDFTALTELPKELLVSGKFLKGKKVSSGDSPNHNSELDLGAQLGGRKEGKTAYLLTAIDIDREMDVTLCASADWWMKWWLNGLAVYDTLEKGNEGNPSSLIHSFMVHLKAGRNLIAVKVVSGTSSFTLRAGGPRELREDLRGSKLIQKKVMEDAPLLLVPPRIRKFDEPEHLPERNDFTMSSGIARTPKGRLWVSWFGGEDGQKAFLMMASSDDDGATWSEPRYIIKEPNTPNGFIRSILGGNLWADPQGRLWCFFAYS
ncbi:MAG: sialidase family protein, partial [Victivallales bacterium]